ncbi:MAG: hypothetical protein LBL83_05385 [Clostridiales bacterium]|nr:hypothetical protein [Clostridiales bacterium]
MALIKRVLGVVIRIALCAIMPFVALCVLNIQTKYVIESEFVVEKIDAHYFVISGYGVEDGTVYVNSNSAAYSGKELSYEITFKKGATFDVDFAYSKGFENLVLAGQRFSVLNRNVSNNKFYSNMSNFAFGGGQSSQTSNSDLAIIASDSQMPNPSDTQSNNAAKKILVAAVFAFIKHEMACKSLTTAALILSPIMLLGCLMFAVPRMASEIIPKGAKKVCGTMRLAFEKASMAMQAVLASDFAISENKAKTIGICALLLCLALPILIVVC